MWTLCLTIKAFNVIAMPRLYEDITIDLTTSRLTSFFLTNNTGHKHVRTLFFEPELKELSDSVGALSTVKRAVRLLPKMSNFAVPEKLPPDAELLRLLSAFELENLELGGPVYAMLSESLNPTLYATTWLSSLKSMTVPSGFGDIRDLQGYNEILRRTPSSIRCASRPAMRKIRQRRPVCTIPFSMLDLSPIRYSNIWYSGRLQH